MWFLSVPLHNSNTNYYNIEVVFAKYFAKQLQPHQKKLLHVRS
jgi:hypothetical protein